jgi:hypothetical protein
VATNDPYAVLGLAPGADTDAVRRAFRRCARHTHPDAGGDAVAFGRVRRAYEMLGGARPRSAAEPRTGTEAPSVGAADATGLVRRPEVAPFLRAEPTRSWTREVVESAPVRTVTDPGPFADVLAEALRRVA